MPGMTRYSGNPQAKCSSTPSESFELILTVGADYRQATGKYCFWISSDPQRQLICDPDIHGLSLSD